MTQHLYAYADVGRAGLGNLLLPWARCEIFRQQRQVPMLAPRWTRAKIGPVLRREQDKRYYVGLFNSQGYVRGLSRLLVLMTARKVGEKEFVHGMEDREGSGRKTVVVFSGLEGMFAPLVPHREMLRRRLTEMLSVKSRRCLGRQESNFVIGAHVRRGDKPTLKEGEPQTSANQGMSDAWFIKSIQNLRRTLGFAAPVRVFSDARAEQLKALLALPNVTLAASNPSIVDLLTLARSRVLLTSAGSSFSMWASFLGEMPTLWYPGGAPGLHPDRPSFESETDLAGRLPREFSEVLESLGLALNP